MAQQVCSGAMLQCSFGTTPSTLSVLQKNRVATSTMPAANIMDHVPTVNIQPFGMCTTPSNPQVAAATAAASGVLTPQPCIPVTTAPWTPGCLKVNVGGQPALTNTCQLMCSYGGVITVVNPGQQKVNVP
ncbi:MAG: DUF4280 domain-containing protein [Anaerolineae bacterium]|nr:DUF4280 domain-containing protein [Anaerolineae bacterium]